MMNFFTDNASAIFGILGTVVGFFGNYFLQRKNQKFEVTKDVAKDYYKDKKNILTKSLQLISDYETKIETLHDYIEDANGVPTRELKKEDVFAKYFLLIFEYLHSYRFYLENETIIKLDRLVNFYHLYTLDIKVIISERDPDDIPNEVATRKQKLFEDAKVLFNGLKEQIKFDEMKNFKAKLEQN